MSIDEQVRTALRAVSGRVDPPAPDVRSLVEGGDAVRRRERAQRVRVLAGCAAACIGLVAVGLALVLTEDPGEDRTADTIADLPVGPPPRIPHCRGGDTIVGAGDPIRTGCMPMITRSGTTIGWNEEGVHLIDHGRLDRLSGRLPGLGVPALSNDGRFAAWLVREPRSVLLVYDRHGRQVAEVDMPTGDGWTGGIDALGRVYVTYLPEIAGPEEVWMYDIPAARLVQVRGLPGFEPGGIKYVTADGFGLDLGHFGPRRLTGHTYLGRVDGHGRFTDKRIVPVGWSTWSPDHSRFVQETADGFWVQGADDLGDHVRLELPDGGLPTATPAWETDDSLLVVFDPDSPYEFLLDDKRRGHVPSSETWVLRCSATTGDCEVALEPGYGGDLNQPMYR